MSKSDSSNEMPSTTAIQGEAAHIDIIVISLFMEIFIVLLVTSIVAAINGLSVFPLTGDIGFPGIFFIWRF